MRCRVQCYCKCAVVFIGKHDFFASSIAHRANPRRNMCFKCLWDNHASAWTTCDFVWGGKTKRWIPPAVVQLQSRQQFPLCAFSARLLLDDYSYPAWPAQPPEPKTPLGVICARAPTASWYEDNMVLNALLACIKKKKKQIHTFMHPPPLQKSSG